MVLSSSSDELLRSARDAAGTTNVHEAVRDLTRHALRSRLLTATHIARVARTVGEGIDSCGLARVAPVENTHRRAWAGLEDAVGEALRALEVAAREFAEGRAGLTGEERDELLAEIAAMEHSLSDGWSQSHGLPASLNARIGSVTSLLRQAVASVPAAKVLPDGARAAGSAISFMASGVLLGLTETVPAEPAKTQR